MGDEVAMSDDVIKKTVPPPACQRFPQWFEDVLKGAEEVDPVTGKPLPQKKVDPRQVGPAAQQEKKPL